MNQLANFLTVLGRDDAERLSINGVQGGQFRSKLTTVADLKKNPPNPNEDRWYGVAILSDNVTQGRGTDRDVVGVRELYLDLDIKEGGMPSTEAAYRVIGELSQLLGTPPAVVVNSGHGLQPHWPLQRDGDTDWTDASAPAWARAAALMRRWHRLATQVAARHGGAVDNVSDLSRVLRVPGTTNRKSKPYKKVTAEYLDVARPVSLARLAEVLDQAGVAEVDTDRPAAAEVVSTPGEWGWATSMCGYAATMIDGWADDNPTGGRHQWLTSQAVRIAAAHRGGCLTERGHQRAVEALEARFEALVTTTSPERAPAPGEVADALDWGVDRVTGMTEEAVRAELGAHEHEEPAEDNLDAQSEEWFWTSRERLARLRNYARAAKVAPWAMLGATLGIVASRIGPKVVLPPLGVQALARTGRGGIASLNVFVGLVGAPGSGKDVALGEAEAFLWLEDRSLPKVKLGTGQGVAAQYTKQISEKGKGTRIVQFNDTCLFVAREVDTLAAHTEMGGSNLLATLKDAYSGAELGEGYAKVENRRPVGEHQYRAVLICGIQPSHAGAILEDADGGFPQRWLWFLTNDPGRPRTSEEELVDILGADWTPPRDLAPQGDCADTGVVRIQPQERVVLEVCQTARDEGEALRDRALDLPADGAVDNLDGHAHLTQRKVAALLSLFDDRGGHVSEEDWKLAGVVMAHSRMARRVCEKAVAGKAEERNRQRARNEGVRRAIAADAEAEVVDETVTQASKRVLKVLDEAAGEWVTGSTLRRKLRANVRRHFERVVEALMAAGAVEAEQYTANGQDATHYRRASTVKK